MLLLELFKGQTLSLLAWEFAEAVNQLGRENSVTVKWIPRHTTVNGNER